MGKVAKVAELATSNFDEAVRVVSLALFGQEMSAEELSWKDFGRVVEAIFICQSHHEQEGKEK